MPAVFFKEVATRHDVFDDVKLTSQFTVLIVKLECLIRIAMRQKKSLEETPQTWHGLIEKILFLVSLKFDTHAYFSSVIFTIKS